MRDAINLNRAGHPTVIFVFDAFERSARAQAQALGVADLPIYAYRQFEPGAASSAAPEEMKAVQAARAFQSLLVKNTGE